MWDCVGDDDDKTIRQQRAPARRAKATCKMLIFTWKFSLHFCPLGGSRARIWIIYLSNEMEEWRKRRRCEEKVGREKVWNFCAFEFEFPFILFFPRVIRIIFSIFLKKKKKRKILKRSENLFTSISILAKSAIEWKGKKRIFLMNFDFRCCPGLLRRSSQRENERDESAEFSWRANLVVSSGSDSSWLTLYTSSELLTLSLVKFHHLPFFSSDFSSRVSCKNRCEHFSIDGENRSEAALDEPFEPFTKKGTCKL